MLHIEVMPKARMVKKLSRTASAVLEGGCEWLVNLDFGRF